MVSLTHCPYCALNCGLGLRLNGSENPRHRQVVAERWGVDEAALLGRGRSYARGGAAVADRSRTRIARARGPTRPIRQTNQSTKGVA